MSKQTININRHNKDTPTNCLIRRWPGWWPLTAKLQSVSVQQSIRRPCSLPVVSDAISQSRLQPVTIKSLLSGHHDRRSHLWRRSGPSWTVRLDSRPHARTDQLRMPQLALLRTFTYSIQHNSIQDTGVMHRNETKKINWWEDKKIRVKKWDNLVIRR